MLTGLVNAPAFVQRALAVALLLTGLAGLGALLISAKGLLTARAEAVTSLRESAGKLMSVAKMKEPLKLEIGANNVVDTFSSSHLIASTASVARANLQGKLNAIADAQTATIASISIAPDRKVHGLDQIGINVSLSATMAELHNTILAFEKTTPVLFVDDLTIQLMGNLNSVSLDQDPVLSAQFKIYGFFVETPVIGALGQ